MLKSEPPAALHPPPAFTLVLKVKWGQACSDDFGGQSAALAGLKEVLSDPVKQPGMGVPGARRLVEVNDACSGDRQPDDAHQHVPASAWSSSCGPT